MRRMALNSGPMIARAPVVTGMWPSVAFSPEERYPRYAKNVSNGPSPAIDPRTLTTRQCWRFANVMTGAATQMPLTGRKSSG